MSERDIEAINDKSQRRQQRDGAASYVPATQGKRRRQPERPKHELEANGSYQAHAGENDEERDGERDGGARDQADGFCGQCSSRHAQDLRR